MKKIVMNCDTGIDDALAIAYIVSQQQAEVIGIAATYGMSCVENVYRNCTSVLELLGRSDIPVRMGSRGPLGGEPVEADRDSSIFHGFDGIGNVLGKYRPEDIGTARPEESIDYMIDMIHRYGKELTLVTTGPLTDLAKVIQRDPSVTTAVGKVVSMAGTLVATGNVSVHAEANADIDAAAAKIVLESDLPLTLVGLDVTRKVILTGPDYRRWQEYDTRKSRFFCKCLEYYMEAYQSFRPYLHGCALHDPLAAVIAIHPELVTAVPMHLTCMTDGELKGKICEDLDRCLEPDYYTKGCLAVDAEAFSRDFFQVMEAMFTS